MKARSNLKWLLAGETVSGVRVQVSGGRSESANGKTLPSAPAMARNLARAVAGMVAGAAKGRPTLVSEVEQARRHEVCHACTGSNGWYLAAQERCAHPRCGCYLRYKTWLHSERCPAGKW